MSQFNSSISTVGIKEPKVQQAILKLLENSLYQKERLGKVSGAIKEELRLLKQKLSTIDFEIDDDTAQEIADKISEAIGDSVSDATAAAQTATQKAAAASEAAASAAEDAQAVSTALANMESTIEAHAEEAARTAAANAVEDATTAAQTATTAAQTATQKANAATTSANNAATTAAQAASAAQEASAAIATLHNVNLCGTTTYNATYDQYRKIATLPAVSSAAGAWVTIYGAIGGRTNENCKPIYVSLSQRQSGTSFSEIEAVGYVFGSALSTMADIVLYKESNDTFSLYLKGTKATYFRHNVAMMHSELVTAVNASYSTTTPTGTLVWSLLASNKIVSTTDHNHDSAYAAANHNHDSAYAAANHNHDSTYAAAGHNHDSSYAAKSHTHDYAASNHNHDSTYAPITREYVAWAHINVDLAGSTYNMSGLVSDSSATYNVRVLFRNTASTARTVTAGGKSASLASGNGNLATIDFTATGSGTFTIDNIAATVDVFVRIWR